MFIWFPCDYSHWKIIQILEGGGGRESTRDCYNLIVTGCTNLQTWSSTPKFKLWLLFTCIVSVWCSDWFRKSLGGPNKGFIKEGSYKTGWVYPCLLHVGIVCWSNCNTILKWDVGRLIHVIHIHLLKVRLTHVNMHLHTCVCDVCVYVCLCLSVWEKEREREIDIYRHTYANIHTHMSHFFCTTLKPADLWISSALLSSLFFFFFSPKFPTVASMKTRTGWKFVGFLSNGTIVKQIWEAF